MSRVDNPFYSMVELMRKEGSHGFVRSFYIGKVISAIPFLVAVDKIQLSRQNIRINPNLLPREESTTIKSEKATFDGQEGKLSVDNGKLTLNGGLNAGDLVVLLTLDSNTFYLICKVV